MLLKLCLHILIKILKLNPSNMSVTTTTLSSKYFDILIKNGINKFTLRNIEEAKNTKDGSGFFYNPYSNTILPSLSIEYTINNETIEILEFEFDKNKSGFGIGLERVIWAQTGYCKTWNESLDELLKDLETESSEREIQLPKGYYTMKQSKICE